MTLRKLISLSVGLLGVIGLILFFIWPRNHVEIQLRDTKSSPDGRWVAIVQLEVRNAGWVVNDAVYAVRLQKAGQKGVEGDLVMNVPVKYPEPEPSVSWRDDTLLITLANEQSYQYLVSSVDGVDVVVQRGKHIESGTGTKP